MSGRSSSKFINPLPNSIPEHFEGRQFEIQELTDFIKNDHQKILTIIGRAGSGKTVLACRVLQSLETGKFPNDLGEFSIDGVVNLSELNSYKVNVVNIFSGLLQLIDHEQAVKLEELYKEGKFSTEVKIRALLKALPDNPIVLLLDNFETLLEKSASSLRDSELLDALKTILLVKKNTLKVIITTRVPPRDLVEIEPGEHHILHLDKGLEYPYAENVLRKLDRNGRAGFKNASEDLFRKDSRSNVRFSTSSRILLLRCLC
ncbi:MAG: ATP-binding protein [Chloroflexi bacterium]|nr:ATP-binding protein [Chloroflexota bacterium]